MTKQLVCLVIGALAAAGCAKPIADWDVRLGDRTDRSTGYYSYKVGLPTQQASDVCVRVASRATLEGREIFRTDADHAVYPARAYVPPHVFAHPEDLEWLVVECTHKSPAAPDTLEVGYFHNFLGSNYATILSGGSSEGNAGGLKWKHLSEKARGDLEEEVSEMRARAAAEGAHALVDVAVYRVGIPSVFGAPGSYVTGRAIALGELD